MSRPSATRVKRNVLVELVSRDIKELQKAQSDRDNTLTNSDQQSQALCDHLDHILMHGLREFEDGYWPFVSHFTRNELVQSINHLKRVTTGIGKGRSWLYTALNEQSMESYVRIFAENQDFVQEFYLRGAFLRDNEHLLLLLTLVSGLDYISFGLEVDCDYLDYGASQLSSRITSRRPLVVQPAYLSMRGGHAPVIQPRRNSDPDHKLPQILPSSGDDREMRDCDISTSSANTTGGVDNEKGLSHRQRNLSEGVDIPCAEKPHPPVMSSSLQMTPPSRNLLDRMSSLELRSPFLERKSGDGRSKMERGGERVGVGGGERVRGDVGEGSEDNVLVARGRKSGKGKKKRRRRREDRAYSDTVTKDGSGNSSHTSLSSSRQYHVTDHQSHVTQLPSHVTTHVIQEEKIGSRDAQQKSMLRENSAFRPYKDTTVTVSADEREAGGTVDAVHLIEEGREGDISIPHNSLEECDFEMEPKSAVVSHLAPLMRREGEGGREGGGGGGMSLEMELALAAKDIENPLQGNIGEGGVVCRERNNRVKPGGFTAVRRGGFPQVTETETDSGDGGDQLEQSFPPSEATPLLNDLPDSSTAADPFEDEVPPPIYPPHTLTHHQKHMRHTAAAHRSLKLQHLNSRTKTERDTEKQSSSRKSGSQLARETSPNFEADFDVITRTEVREVTEQRKRANAVFQGEEEEEEDVEGEARLSLTEVASTTKVKYDGPPRRSQQITERDKRTNDIKIDETMKVVFSIDVYLTEGDGPAPDSDRQQRVSLHAEEDARRLVQVNTPVGLGQYRTGYVLVTTEAVYLLRRDGIEGIFSRDFGARYSDIDHLVIGLGWQSIELVFKDSSSTMAASVEAGLQSCVILTGSEAVSRRFDVVIISLMKTLISKVSTSKVFISEMMKTFEVKTERLLMSLMDSIQTAATMCPGFRRVIPKNRDDENRVEAIEKELIKLGSETNMDIVQYSFVNWEQVKGESPKSIQEQSCKVSKSGVLHFKSTSVLGLSSWKQAFFKLRDGTLYQYNSETDKVLRATYPLTGCGGCTRVTGESKSFVLSISLNNTQPLLLAATTKEDLIQWIQALCEAILPVPSANQRRNLMCTVLLTKSKVHILQEDLSSGTVRHITCCEVTAVEEIRVDQYLPLYCAISYDDGEGYKGVWLLCFNSEHELGKFETALAALWKEEFQINLPFSELEELTICQRAHHAIDLMQASGLRSDSISKGRTEFRYSSAV